MNLKGLEWTYLAIRWATWTKYKRWGVCRWDKEKITPWKSQKETIMSIVISQGQTSTSFQYSDNPEQAALYLQSVLSLFRCPGYSPRGVIAAWGACPPSADRCEPGLHVRLTWISWSKFPFSKGSSQSTSSKHRAARRLLPTDQRFSWPQMTNS